MYKKSSFPFNFFHFFLFFSFFFFGCSTVVTNPKRICSKRQAFQQSLHYLLDRNSDETSGDDGIHGNEECVQNSVPKKKSEKRRKEGLHTLFCF